MSERDRLRKAVLITAGALIVLVAAFLTAIVLMLDHDAHRAAHSLGTIVPPASPAGQAGQLLPHPPAWLMATAGVLVVAGVIFRVKRKR